jgi:isocitrate dehydrogenase kinase/phosphatase
MPAAKDTGPDFEEASARRIAVEIIEGFNRHYQLFRNCSAAAKQRFEAADWHGVQDAVRDRLAFYDARVRETVERLNGAFAVGSLDDAVWQRAKRDYISLLIGHPQAELAETFFNSVFCRLQHRTYFHNEFIFFRPAVSTEFIESDPPTYRSYYPLAVGVAACLRKVLLDFGWSRPFEDLDRDIGYVIEAIRRQFPEWPQPQPNLQIHVLHSAFYRNKAAYVIGKVVNGTDEFPFTVPVLHTPTGRLYLDTILFDPWRIANLFSLSRAYFMVDMPVPSAYVQFLGSLMPGKPRSELYTMLGLGKQGKTMFFRDLFHHLHHSQDRFIVAPGIAGLVMMVFTLPSYPYVFKVIKDVFGPGKDMDQAAVKRKYQLVKQVDRVGRLADTLEFSYAALPRNRFSPELIEELKRQVPSQLEEDGDELVIKHLYIERRMEPLNLYLDRAEKAGREDLIDQVVREFGNAIRELAIANIFPGDMLWKNFGVARFGRVVFYDYDEIEYMTDVNFRRIPPAPDPEMELSADPWYSVGRNDVFPEEFANFLLTSPRIRQAFLKYHADLVDAEFWKGAQAAVRRGELQDFFPYPESFRFCRAFAREP